MYTLHYEPLNQVCVDLQFNINYICLAKNVTQHAFRTVVMLFSNDLTFQQHGVGSFTMTLLNHSVLILYIFFFAVRIVRQKYYCGLLRVLEKSLKSP